MIPEYKLYHGAVLAELVHELSQPVLVDELNESGRLSSYVLNGRVGLQIKHATQRLTPWCFTFTRQNMVELLALRERFDNVFIAFVCESQGMLCLTVEELLSVSRAADSDQVWIRIDRRRGKWFQVHGSEGPLSSKKPDGLGQLIAGLLSSPEPSKFMRAQMSERFPSASV